MKNLANKTVLVPFDFSDQASAAIDQAIRLAEESTNIYVIHVVEPTPVYIAFDQAMPVPPSYDQERFHHAEQELKKRFADGGDVDFHMVCKIGDPGSEIAAFAEKIGADLIVMPSHGRRGLNRLFLGSVAEHVLRMSHCPVLILRSPKQTCTNK